MNSTPSPAATPADTPADNPADTSAKDPTNGPLRGVRVLDLTRVLAGPTCSQILGDLGADIIKIERPGRGDDSRFMGPPYLDENEDAHPLSAYFLSVNRNKRSLTLDLTGKPGQKIARQLAAKCDILIENFRAGILDRYALSYQRLAKDNPKLIYCSLTGFGQDGPYANRGGYDYLVQALGGLMSVTGTSTGQPMKVGVGVCDIVTGLYATIAIMGAMREREASGKGQMIDCALLDSQVSLLSYLGQSYLVSGQIPQRVGNAHHSIAPYQTFAARDGMIVLAVGNDAQFARFCRFAQCPHLTDDKRFADNGQRVRHRRQLTKLLNPLIIQRPIDYWVNGLTKVNVPCSPINDIGQVFADPQVRARKRVVPMDHPRKKGRHIDVIANPIRYSRSKVSYRRPPPLLGQHNREILRDILGMDDQSIDRLIADKVIDSSPG